MPEIPFVIIVPENCKEKEFIKAVVREARQQAREVWRSSHKYVRNKGGRPTLEKQVDDACDRVWKEWGGKFPKHNSTAAALVREVASRLHRETRNGKGGKARTKPNDLRTIRKYVRGWIAGLAVGEVPDSWLRRPDGRAAARVLRIGAMLHLMREHKDDPSKIEEIRRTYGRLTDKEWADILIKSRRTTFHS